MIPTIVTPHTEEKVVLTTDQEMALKKLKEFLNLPKSNNQPFILSGAAGTGKSFCTKNMVQTIKEFTGRIHCTATTNKASKVLEEFMEIGDNVSTIYSLLKMLPKKNFQTGEYCFQPSKNTEEIYNATIIVDEASLIDRHLLKVMDKYLIDCRIVLVGDHLQLAPPRQTRTELENIKTDYFSELKEIVRNDGIIKKNAMQYRKTVTTLNFPKLEIDGDKIQRLGLVDFEDKLLESFSREDFQENDSRIITWTNKSAIYFNNFIRNNFGYSDQFQAEEIIVTNEAIPLENHRIISVDSKLRVREVSEPTQESGIDGYYVEVHQVPGTRFFLPTDRDGYKKLLRRLANEKDWKQYFDIKESWVDFRPIYAGTVHKAQGSTYKEVFINLKDIGMCNIPTDFARLMYVAISRASERVYLYGNLPDKYKG